MHLFPGDSESPHFHFLIILLKLGTIFKEFDLSHSDWAHFFTF
jgi:hypothetical protein